MKMGAAIIPLRRSAAWGLLLALGLTLAACMLAPGKFAAELDLRKTGMFRFSYTGEIHVLALSKLAEAMNRGNAEGPFTPKPCLEPDGGGTTRKCSAEELAGQKREWEQQQRSAAQRRTRDNESMKAMFGGIDPTSPRAAEELAARLRRQAGWRRVVHRGDGLFDVDFVIEGRLDHDFTFPTIERFPSANPFVQVMRRADGTLRIDAPGFAPAAAGEPYRGWMQAAALSEGTQRAPQLPEVDGTFAIVTDAEVLANNTDEGPQSITTGKRLEWKVNARSQAAPTALIRLLP
jgi:hypothetical protein